MMKKVIRLTFIFITITILSVLTNVKAVTLGDYEAKVNAYEKEMRDNQNKVRLNEEETRRAKNRIEAIKAEMNNLVQEIGFIEKKIEEDTIKIREKDQQSKKIIEYYQLTESSNAYLDYVFEAKDTTSLIYRFAVVEQLIEYNKKTIDELNKLIEQRENRRKEIFAKQKTLKRNQEELASLLVRLGEEKHSLSEGAVGINEQLKLYRDLVNTYRQLGCKSSDRIGIDCAKQGEAGIFRRPMSKGYVTAEFGRSKVYWNYSLFHDGIDLSSYNKSEPIYSVANGRVAHVYKDGGGGLTVVVYYNYRGKTYSGIYIHMRSYGPKIWKGNYITSDDLIGNMGSTGYSTGPHLHLAIAPCKYMDPTDNNCRYYSRYMSYMERMYNQGYKGARNFINFPNGLYKSWSGR